MVRMSRPRAAATFLAFVVVGFAAMVTAVPGSGSADSAANGAAGQSCAATKLSAARWYYNWYVDPNCDASGFVPMVSGRDKQNPGDIQWQTDRAHSGGFRTVLGFNEPNQPGQSVMSVDKALQLWPILTSHDDVKVGSPAVSGGNGGREWMEAFMKGVADKKLRVDFVAAHFYGWNAGTCTTSNLRSYLDWIKGLAGDRPIWVTEIGCLSESNTNAAAVRQFYDDAVKVMRDMGIERWAWYTPETNHALVRDGRLTPLGEDFAKNSGGGGSGGQIPSTEDFPNLYCYANEPGTGAENPNRMHLTNPAVVETDRATTYQLTYLVTPETWDAKRDTYQPDPDRSYASRLDLDKDISQDLNTICATLVNSYPYGTQG